METFKNNMVINKLMKIKFNFWSCDEIIKAYIDFIKIKKSNEIFIKYKNKSNGFKETMEGRLNVDDKNLKDLPKKVQYTYAFHFLELFQKDWKITFHLFLQKDDENENRDYVELLFDNSLKKEVYNHFKNFEPEEIK